MGLKNYKAIFIVVLVSIFPITLISHLRLTYDFA